MALHDIEHLLISATIDAARRPAFYRALVRSTILVPGLYSGESVRLLPTSGTGGYQGSLYPFFTSLAKLRESIPADDKNADLYLEMSCRSFFSMTRGKQRILNPNSEHGKVFLPDEVARLLGADDAMTVYLQDLTTRTEHSLGEGAHVFVGNARAEAKVS